MGRMRWGWSKVKAGQIIRFRYNGFRRVVIVLSSPMDSGGRDKKLLHAIQIQYKGQPLSGMRTKLDDLILKADGVSLVKEDSRTGRYFKLAIGTAPGDKKKSDLFYSGLKPLIKSKDMYKTFKWELCRNGTCYLDNDELNEWNIPVKLLAASGYDRSLTKPPIVPKPKTFIFKPRDPVYKPGDVWEQKSGRWAAKNLKGVIRGFSPKNKHRAEAWAKGIII